MNRTKILALFLALPLALGACKKKEEGTTEDSPKAKAGAKSEPKAKQDKPADKAWTGESTAKALDSCWAAFNAKDSKTVVDCYAKDAEFAYVDFSPTMKMVGAPAIGGVLQMWWGAFPDAKAEPQLLLVNDKKYASIVLMTQTNTGKGMAPPTGKKSVTFEAQSGEFNAAGKIMREHHHVDQATMAHQMGMVPSERAPDSETAWPESIRVLAKNDDKEKANLEFIKGLGAFVDKQDADGMLAAVADDVSFRYIGDKNPIEGKADYGKGLRQWMSMFKIKETNVLEAWAAGDWVFSVTEMQLETLIDLPGTKDTKGKALKMLQSEFFMVKDGKVQKHWIFENGMQMALQLGLIDPTKMGKGGAPKK